MASKKTEYKFEFYTLELEKKNTYPILFELADHGYGYYGTNRYLYIIISGKDFYIRESTDIQYMNVDTLAETCNRYLSDKYIKPYYTIETYEEYGSTCVSAEMYGYRKATAEEIEEIKGLREEQKRNALEIRNQQKNNMLEQARKLLREAGELP